MISKHDAHDSEILIYQATDGKIKLDVRLESDTVWLTQAHMAVLFESSKQNISHHIQSIYDEGELAPEATVKKYLTVRQEGYRQVQRELEHYNLDMISQHTDGKWRTLARRCRENQSRAGR